MVRTYFNVLLSIMCSINGIHRHPFGSTSVRTAPLIKKDEFHMPGPAHYQQDPSSEEADPDAPQPQIKTQKPKKSFMFSSTSKRLYSPPAIVTVSMIECGIYCLLCNIH